MLEPSYVEGMNRLHNILTKDSSGKVPLITSYRPLFLCKYNWHPHGDGSSRQMLLIDRRAGRITEVLKELSGYQKLWLTLPIPHWTRMRGTSVTLVITNPSFKEAALASL
ncbi:hypothetical protein EYF80_018610 [Liparis tanakae]|uniref:Uncharacterized protein n=1 Tax=Liparis tanakae TaxID=230148 RepID=A0A4Z2HZV8_9TELE|nr:hypothetical protein EYF80_018610 [Liparis tanakae]